MRPGFTGLVAWWVQRASAVYMLLFGIFLLAASALRPLHGYAEWKAWVGRPGVTIGLVAFLVALLSHMWVGLRDVLLDYARPAGVQRFLLGAAAAGLVAALVSVIWILLQVSR